MNTETIIGTIKEIAWAYPYSPDAERFGFAKTIRLKSRPQPEATEVEELSLILARSPVRFRG